MNYLSFLEGRTHMYYEERTFGIKYGELSVLLVSLDLDKIYKIIKTYLESLKEGEIEKLKKEINEVDKLKYTSAKYYFGFIYPLSEVLIEEYGYMGEFLISIFTDLINMEINCRIEENINTLNNTYTSSKSDYLKLLKDLDDSAPDMNTSSDYKNKYATLKKQFVFEREEEIKKSFDEITNANDSTKLWENINRIKNNMKAINDLSDDSDKSKQIFEAILDIIFYIPISLYDKQFQEELEAVLLMNDSLLHSYSINKIISNTKVSSSKKINEDNGLDTVYHFSDINSLLWLDLQKYLERDITAKYCEYCGHLFIPTSKKNRMYCSYLNKGNILKCFDLHRQEEDDFRKEAKRARGNQQRRVHNAVYYKDFPSKNYEYDFLKLETVYNAWLLEMTNKYKEFKEKNDLPGLEKWVESTKLTVGEMERLGIRNTLHLDKVIQEVKDD